MLLVLMSAEDIGLRWLWLWLLNFIKCLFKLVFVYKMFFRIQDEIRFNCLHVSCKLFTSYLGMFIEISVLCH